MDAAMFSFSRGFLPKESPLKSLPRPFSAWQNMAKTLPKQLLGSQFRNKLQALPEFPYEKIRTRAEMEASMRLLSFLGHAYIWGASPLVDALPQILAKPWCLVAQALERPPVLSYASYALNNWYRLDPKKPIALGNIALIQNFLGGVDEEWFVLVHIDIEMKAKEALLALRPALQAVLDNDLLKVLAALKSIGQGLEKICATLLRMPEHCDPYIYYQRVRPYIHGWKNNPALPEGLLYEGCFGGQKQAFRGETGAQSSIVPALDRVLGIVHEENALSVYLQEMQDYMPKDHRNFLKSLEKGLSLRAYVEAQWPGLPELAHAYNHCIDKMVEFRTTHLKYAALYIQKQDQASKGNPTALGTGGTPFMAYLAKHEKEAEKHKILLS